MKTALLFLVALAAAAGPGEGLGGGWVGAGGVGSQTLEAWSGFSLGTENPGHAGARTK